MCSGIGSLMWSDGVTCAPYNFATRVPVFANPVLYWKKLLPPLQLNVPKSRAACPSPRVNPATASNALATVVFSPALVVLRSSGTPTHHNSL